MKKMAQKTRKSVGKYRYKMWKLSAGSSKYGNCEVCKNPAGTTYHQVEERSYRKPDGSIGWTRNKCRDLFGHKSCLIKKRR
jgi:hypothetical protein